MNFLPGSGFIQLVLDWRYIKTKSCLAFLRYKNNILRAVVKECSLQSKWWQSKVLFHSNCHCSRISRLPLAETWVNGNRWLLVQPIYSPNRRLPERGVLCLVC